MPGNYNPRATESHQEGVRFPPVKPFFFILPADGTSNNVRILVNRAAVRSMRQPAET